MYAIHKQAAPPSGVAHSLSARLTPSCLQSTSSSRSRIFRNLVTATNDYLQLFEIIEELVPLANAAGVVANGAVNGHAGEPGAEKLDEGEDGARGEGQNGHAEAAAGNARARLQLVKDYKLHGTITGLQRIQTVDTARDGLDRLLVSFKNAKASLLEWSSEIYDLVTVSLHTFEKLPQLIQGDLTGYTSLLRTDPLSRCAALLLPQDALAITPFFQDQIELEGADENVASLPYAPSSVIELTEISPELRNVVDFVFLSGFNEPTLAILTRPTLTWTGRLENAKDIMQLFLVTIDVISTPPSSTIISQTPSLPYDCKHLTACPRDLGGVLISTNNSLIHVDQAGKRIGAAFNPWANAVTDTCKFDQASGEPLALEDSKTVFITSEVALLFLSDGRVSAIRVQRDGRTISKIVLLPDVLKRVSTPSSVELIRSHLSARASDGSVQACYIFVASLLTDSQLVKIDFTTTVDQAELERSMEQADPIGSSTMQDDDDDIDIYGSFEAKRAVVSDAFDTRLRAATRFCVTLSSSAVLPAYGPIRHATMGIIEDDGPHELVACTGGDGCSGGLTVIHKSLLPTARQRVNLDHTTEHVSIVHSRAADGEPKTWLFTSSDGETQLYSILDSDPVEPEYVKTFAKMTLSAHAFRHATRVAYLLRDTLVITDAEAQVLQKIALPEGHRATRATVAGDYILIDCDDGSSILFGEDDGAMKTLTLPDDGAATITIFHDEQRSFPALSRAGLQQKRRMLFKGSANPSENINDQDDDIYGESDMQTRHLSNKPAADQNLAEDLDESLEALTWLCSITKEGLFKIYLLPDLEVVFSSGDALSHPITLNDTQQTASFEEMPEDVVLDRAHLFYAGQTHLRPHLLLLMEDGTCVVYEACEDFAQSSFRLGPSRSLAIRWVKVQTFALGNSKRAKAAADETELGPAERQLIPFAELNGYTGAFLAGEHPIWLVRADASCIRVYECDLKPAYGFTTHASRALISTGRDVVVGEMPNTTCMQRVQPFTKVIEDRLYTGIAYDRSSRCYAAIAAFQAPFEIFDEEGEPAHPVDGEKALEPTGTRSTLELIEPGSWTTVDGYEFRQYETALCVSMVSLETKSTTSGFKDFLAVGTIIARGEDLASKGALYIFEIMTVEPRPGSDTYARKLRLLLTEELKAPISCVERLNCYALHSVGLKMYAKAFDQDERLLSVGFFDVGLHTTCIRSLKNLFVLGDAMKGLSLFAFQEDPYKFVLLGQEVVNTPIATADFLASEGKAQLVASDTNGNLRFYEFDPLRAETHGGRRLLPRIEYHTGIEATYSLPFARTVGGDVKQSGILLLHADGSMSTVMPVRDAVYKRLQLLERQLIRHTHHFAGLNPRAFRTVRNDYVPRPLSKGLLDGDLLAAYSKLSTVRQQQLADPLGSDSDTINYNLRSLSAPW